ncbi:hypothetical protein BJ742DRAFT_788531 [Cladochytrium replicatum]|nr:hypothetical protein BJ742DRAFT_788531 [Cladochytrium replicatum]
MGHVFFVGTLDLAIAFFLYRTALSLDKVRSWSVLQRPFGQRSSEVSRSIVEHNELVSMNQNTTASTASQRAGQASMPASGGSEVTVYSPNMQRSQPRTLIQKIFSSRHHRRVTLLLILAVFMQVLGGSFFVIPVAFPGLSQKSRAYESISMNLYLLHLLVILWFLESFKEVVLAPGSGTRAGEYFSSITVEPQSGNAGTTS